MDDSCSARAFGVMVGLFGSCADTAAPVRRSTARVISRMLILKPREHGPTLWPRIRLPMEEVADGLLHHLPGDFRDRAGERDVLRAGLHAILRVAAFLDAAIAHQRLQTFLLEHAARRMRIEQANLRDGRRTYEPGA